ncbi:MAG: pyrroline-5-carboxylate reductase [Clostridia bacterium]|nr:pyrroline-5-carboxylate reductase [Clostridia bacterium]
MFDFGFIGCGHMGAILAAAIVKTGRYSVGVSNATEELTKSAAQKTGATPSDNLTLAKSSRFLVLAVRPQDLSPVIAEISPYLKDTVIISVLAGVTVEKIKDAAGDVPVIRIMPNTPATVGEGVILYSAKGVNKDCVDTFLDAFSLTGSLFAMDEKDIDAGCAVSGCGPAFVYRFIEHFADAGNALGIDKDLAVRLAAQTVLGAAKMVLSGEGTPDALCNEVCSPGGATIEGVKTMDASDIADVMKQTLASSFNRTKELGKN